MTEQLDRIVRQLDRTGHLQASVIRDQATLIKTLEQALNRFHGLFALREPTEITHFNDVGVPICPCCKRTLRAMTSAEKA